MSFSLTIIGAGGHAISVANVAVSIGYSIISFVDSEKAGQKIMEIPIISEEACMSDSSKYNYAIAIGDNDKRIRAYEKYIKVLPNPNFPFLIHKSAVIGIHSQIEEGSVIMPNTNIGPNSKVGRFCIINTNSSIDHDCLLGDFASVAPGVITGGNVTIGKLSALSIGVNIAHRRKIGSNSVIGASSFVNKDIGNNVLAYGIPCKTIGNRKQGDPYL